MTPEQLASIRERAEAATEGPWLQGREKVRYESAREVYTERDPSRTSRDVCRADEADEDAEFIAHAREDVPALLAEVERLQRADALMLDSARSTPTGLDIQMHAGGPNTQKALIFIADAMRSQLDEYEATNYLEMQLRASDGKNYVMTLQRQGGAITPHEARQAAEARLDKVRALHVRDAGACWHCERGFTCPTIQALDGSDQ